jgi:pimeloyl-ACP methyl ester carboxylesterase/DNA-binding winged helix-turn-helix (wHTH) protein
VQYLFGDYSLDCGRRELHNGSALIAIEPQVFDLLAYLVENRDRVVSKDDLFAAVWHGRIVSESALTSRINAVRKAVGDSGEQQAVIRTIARKGFRFVGAISDQARAGSAPPMTTAQALPPATSSHLRQEIHFCTTSDGARIAYAEVGQGPPLIKTANWLNHLEYDWESPIWSHFLDEIAASHRLFRYDARGNGLSDWDVADISLEAFVHDLETVIEATGIERFPLLGISQGCAVSIAYAVRHPERVTQLILYGGYALGRRRRGSQREIERADAIITLMRDGWGQENPEFRMIYTSQFIPGGTAEQMQWFNDLQRMTTPPENAMRIRLAMDQIDVTDLLPQITVPTLVMHCRGDAAVPFEEGRRMAAGIRGSHFVALEGRNHLILESDPSWGRFVREIKAFLQR